MSNQPSMALFGATKKPRKLKASGKGAAQTDWRSLEATLGEHFTFVFGDNPAHAKALANDPPKVRRQHRLTTSHQASSVPVVVRQMSPLELHIVTKAGLPASVIAELSAALQRPIGSTSRMLGVPASTLARQAKAEAMLSQPLADRTMRAVGLIGLVQSMVAEYGDPALAKDFDAAHWLNGWLDRPQPSLQMRKPAELLDTASGVEAVETLLKRIAVDAFA